MRRAGMRPASGAAKRARPAPHSLAGPFYILHSTFCISPEVSMALTVQKVLVKVFGSRNDRLLKRYRRIVDEVSKLETKVQQMSDEQLRARTLELHTGLTAGDDPDDKPTLRAVDVMPEALAIVREAMDRNIGIRQIFNPDESEFGSAKFDPNKLDDPGRKAFFDTQQRLIA